MQSSKGECPTTRPPTERDTKRLQGFFGSFNRISAVLCFLSLKENAFSLTEAIEIEGIKDLSETSDSRDFTVLRFYNSCSVILNTNVTVDIYRRTLFA